jgi:TPR repeat protein
MYADGDGVPQDDILAFQYFSRITDQYFARISSGHADDNPEAPQARFIANALVTLGHYYLVGIANSPVKTDPERAKEMFSYAASYFNDPDAQYNLARLYLHGDGADPKLAIRWFGLAANKGQYEAQAMLGAMLFKGDQVPRQGALGLMWLTLARDAAPAKGTTWVAQLYDSAFKQATDDERGLALRLLEDRLKHRRE